MSEERWSRDYSGRCGNCHERINRRDKYCRYCGTKRGQGLFAPYENLMQCIYGPMPVKRARKCTNCGKEWTTILMIDNEDYCPDCGAETIIVASEDATDRYWYPNSIENKAEDENFEWPPIDMIEPEDDNEDERTNLFDTDYI